MSAVPVPAPATDETRGTLSPTEEKIVPRARTSDIRYCEVRISVGNEHETLEVECHGRATHGFPGTRYTPKEPGGYIVDAIFFRGVEIREVLGEKLVEAIERRVNEA